MQTGTGLTADASFLFSHRPYAIDVTPPFHSPRAFDPSYSLLGRAIRAWTDDRLRGEALYIVVLTGLGLGLLMSHYLSWTLLQPLFVAQPSWQTVFWTVQALSVLVLGCAGLVGFRPCVTVSWTSSALTLEQGPRSHVVAHSDIEHVETISAHDFHRHYRRYAATILFVSQVPDELLLLRTPRGPIVVALPNPEAQAALRLHLDTAERKVSDVVPQA